MKWPTSMPPYLNTQQLVRLTKHSVISKVSKLLILSSSNLAGSEIDSHTKPCMSLACGCHVYDVPPPKRKKKCLPFVIFEQGFQISFLYAILDVLCLVWYIIATMNYGNNYNEYYVLVAWNKTFSHLNCAHALSRWRDIWQKKVKQRDDFHQTQYMLLNVTPTSHLKFLPWTIPTLPPCKMLMWE
jgi:hypothetical protein